MVSKHITTHEHIYTYKQVYTAKEYMGILGTYTDAFPFFSLMMALMGVITHEQPLVGLHIDPDLRGYQEVNAVSARVSAP